MNKKIIKKIINKKSIIFIFILIISAFLLTNCTAVMLGVPDTFRGYYQSTETILHEDNYLFIRVSAGSLTVYLGTNGQTNIARSEYTAITPYNIIGYGYDYTFENGKMSGVVNFDGRNGANVKLNESNPPIYWEGYCQKVN